ncbi:MAG TPA: hypothetical protein DD434_10190, partial [Bacteroidales bacterium]|nr:hypothetical protein [Bacteroidales bacterium]
MLKRFTITLSLILISLISYCQTLSDQQRKDIISDLQKQITVVSAFSSEKLDMIPVYNSQLLNANKTLDKYETYKSDNLIYAKWFELKTLVKQNKEMVNFLEPRVGDWFYRKAVGFVANNEKAKAVEFLNKALVYDSKNVMVNYELAKISLDSGKIVGAT